MIPIPLDVDSSCHPIVQHFWHDEFAEYYSRRWSFCGEDVSSPRSFWNGVFRNEMYALNSCSVLVLFVTCRPLGVTVRRIQFIDDPSTSSAAHPLYAVLVSREMEADLSSLNDDGLTSEERQRLREEKENAKIKRQVEADLGGFDIEQEWVEEIEREDCFKVDTDLGGAPPVPNRAYSLWVVDAANGWQVVDSYELGEQEHGMTMQVMQLTEVGIHCFAL